MQKNNIVNAILSLPSLIRYDGIEFELQITKNVYDIKIGYIIVEIDPDSMYFMKMYSKYKNYSSLPFLYWENPFNNNNKEQYLILIENIKNDNDLLIAINKIKRFLIDKGFIDKGFYENNRD